ncbi:MAG TPA: DUF192 domain-containing protein [Candidatus Peribacteraceae bacterium]|nr:DUF192 domain-containing protein [Candidatus Peribacteraceae bacterium]
MSVSFVIGRFLALLIIGLCGIAACLWMISTFLSSAPSDNPRLHPLTLVSPGGRDTTLQVEWATTEAQRERGLMNRATVDHGMLFIFDTEQQLTFWMKNTLVPLDVMFFDDRGDFVSSAQMTPCTADPCALYASASPAKYALEMPAGFVTQADLGKGWTMRP